MGVWGTSVTGNDTAMDLYIEYSAAFYKYDTEKALAIIDNYVRTSMFDETDEEEWCNYVYSLADFMWKKGILTDSVRDKAVGMIDSGFGLELWAEAGQKTLNSRKKILQNSKKRFFPLNPQKRKLNQTYTQNVSLKTEILLQFSYRRRENHIPNRPFHPCPRKISRSSTANMC